MPDSIAYSVTLILENNKQQTTEYDCVLKFKINRMFILPFDSRLSPEYRHSA